MWLDSNISSQSCVSSPKKQLNAVDLMPFDPCFHGVTYSMKCSDSRHFFFKEVNAFGVQNICVLRAPME